jgi:hypothetical protein
VAMGLQPGASCAPAMSVNDVSLATMPLIVLAVFCVVRPRKDGWACPASSLLFSLTSSAHHLPAHAHTNLVLRRSLPPSGIFSAFLPLTPRASSRAPRQPFGKDVGMWLGPARRRGCEVGAAFSSRFGGFPLRSF